MGLPASVQHLSPARAHAVDYRATDLPAWTERLFQGLRASRRRRPLFDACRRTPADVTIQDPRQGTIYKQRLFLDHFGGFSGKLTLSPAASTGYFDLHAKIGVSTADLSFQVAEYVKPNYAVTVVSDRGANANYTQGQTVGVQVRASYYFGAPLTNAPVTWDLTESDFDYSSVLFPDYSFGDNDYVDLMNYQGSNGQEVTQGSGKTDSHGDFHFSVPANVKANPRSQQFTLEAILTGPDNQQVAQNTQVVVHKSSVYVGLKPADYLQTAGKPNVIRLVTTSEDGEHVVPGRPVILKLYKRVWLSSFVRDSNGNYYWQDSHKDTLVHVSSLHTNAQGKADVIVSPADGGEYVVEAIATDSAGRTSSSKLSLWVLGTGAAYVPWQPENNMRARWRSCMSMLTATAPTSQRSMELKHHATMPAPCCSGSPEGSPGKMPPSRASLYHARSFQRAEPERKRGLRASVSTAHFPLL